MTAKEFAEKYVGRKIHYHSSSANSPFGIVSGYSQHNEVVYEPLTAGVGWIYNLGDLITLLRPLQRYFYFDMIWFLFDKTQRISEHRFTFFDDEPIITTKADDRFPHLCGCGSKAYIGAFKIECSKSGCNGYQR